MKQIPNILSTVRIILAPVFVVMYLQDEEMWRSLSVAVFAIAAMTDFFDGYIARHYKATSSYGTFLDPLADKILTFAGFICLPLLDPQQFPWWAVALIVLRDAVVTGLRMMADKRKKAVATRYSAKVKTFIQMLFLYAALLAGVFAKGDVVVSPFSREVLESGILGWLLYVVVIITVYTGIEYLYLNRELFTSHDNTPTETYHR